MLNKELKQKLKLLNIDLDKCRSELSNAESLYENQYQQKLAESLAPLSARNREL